MTKLNTSMFDEQEKKAYVHSLTFEKFIDSLNEDLGKLRDKMALQAIPQIIKDINWLKRNLIIFLIFQVAINIVLLYLVLK